MIGVTNNYLSGTLTVGVEPNIVWSRFKDKTCCEGFLMPFIPQNLHDTVQ
jgi:hypothetical protein